MIRVLTRAAFQVDAWLHRRLGPAYGMAISVGLIIDIGHRILETSEHLEARHRLIGVALAVAMEAALLIHQVGELHHRVGGKGRAEG